MELRVYRENKTTLASGVEIYSGEDALPYVGDGLLTVADGLGGQGAIRHKEIDDGLLDGDSVIGTLFRDVLDDAEDFCETDERFSTYVKDSFKVLRPLKECYRDDRHHLKKSSFFGSRIVSAILLHKILTDPRFSDGTTVFDEYAALAGEENGDEKTAFCRQMGQEFADAIRETLEAVAKKVNFHNESSIQSMIVLATTLSATLYCEREDCVEAFCLAAGDSRSYVWTEADGMCQLMEDQERADGGMTNVIGVGEPFGLECRHFSFPKPCVLFNASDGCFDSGLFYSPLMYEKLILECLRDSTSAEEAEAALVRAFDTYGTHDDSSTMALKTFGYPTYDDWKEASCRRLSRIGQQYTGEMDDLFAADYAGDLEKLQWRFRSDVGKLKSQALTDRAVLRYCEDKAGEEETSPIKGDLCEVDKKIREAEKTARKCADAVRDIIAGNLISLILLDAGNGRSEGDEEPRQEEKKKEKDTREEATIKRLSELEKEREIKKKKFLEQIEQCRKALDSACETMQNAFSDICALGAPDSFEDYVGIDFDAVKACQPAVEKLFDFFRQLESKRQKDLKKYEKVKEEYERQNRKFAEDCPECVTELRDGILTGDIPLGDELKDALPSKAFSMLSEFVSGYTEAGRSVRDLKTVDRAAILNRGAQHYLSRHTVEVLLAMVEDPELSDELRERIRSLTQAFAEQTKGLDKKAEKQTELFRRYETGYRKYLGGE